MYAVRAIEETKTWMSDEVGIRERKKLMVGKKMNDLFFETLISCWPIDIVQNSSIAFSTADSILSDNSSQLPS